MNVFGNALRISIFGESHGALIGVTIDGVKAGIALNEDDFAEDLSRRRAGITGSTTRIEGDHPTIVSGLYKGYTTGAPLTILFKNENCISKDYPEKVTHFRPSHADWCADKKYNGYNDPRGGGHFSGRVTLALVAAGVIAKKLIPEVSFNTKLAEVGGVTDAELFSEIINEVQLLGDSVGAIVECCAEGVEAALGEPFFDSVESLTSHLLFSIPGVKGVEFGSGFEAARMRGSEHNDSILNSRGTTATNNSGGIVGGITNGNPIRVRVAFKPTASIALPQLTYNASTERVETLTILGRHDSCIALRGSVVVESVLAIALAELKLRG